MILIAARHAAPATCTPRDKQTRFSKQNKDKRKTNETVPDSNSNVTKSMNHHNQTKKLTTWFLNYYYFHITLGPIVVVCIVDRTTVEVEWHVSLARLGLLFRDGSHMV
jgi:hypothetical protein